MGKYAYIKMICWLAGSVLAMAAPSCTYRLTDENWERDGRVRLLLSWPSGEHPEKMTWYFYKEGANSPIVRSGDASGYEGTLPRGGYRIAICNTDCSNVALEMENGYENAFGKVAPLSSLKSSSVHVAHPGNLYGGGSDLVEIGGEETARTELHPTSLVRELDLNIKVEGEEEELGVRGLSGRLTGVASGIHIPSGKPLFDPPAYMTFDPEERDEAGVYATSLSLFGLSPGEEEGGEPVDLHLTMTLTDGTPVTSVTDITKDVEDAFAASISAHVILDLTIRYDEISGLTVSFMKWKTGNDGSGEIGPLETEKK